MSEIMDIGTKQKNILPRMFHSLKYSHKLPPFIFSKIPSVLRNKPYVINNNELLLQLLLDPTHPMISEVLSMQDHTIGEIEEASQNLMYALHQMRLTEMNANL